MQVYRGVCSLQDLELPVDRVEAFQTWGPGARFALVPVDHYQRVAWFAAVSSPRLKPSDYFSGLESENGSVLASEEEKERLVRHFSSWHSPIPEILRRSLSDPSVTRNEAFASRRLSEGPSPR